MKKSKKFAGMNVEIYSNDKVREGSYAWQYHNSTLFYVVIDDYMVSIETKGDIEILDLHSTNEFSDDELLDYFKANPDYEEDEDYEINYNQTTTNTVFYKRIKGFFEDIDEDEADEYIDEKEGFLFWLVGYMQELISYDDGIKASKIEKNIEKINKFIQAQFNA